jgi:DNA-binding winged helix-turn-helix (wHTH) protein
MDALSSADMLLLGTLRFNQRSRALFRLDTGTQISIGSRAGAVLGVLLERAGDIVPKDEIIKAVWPDTVVGDGNLTVHISTLRRVLDTGRLEGSCIQTISGRGYRFIGEVRQNNPNTARRSRAVSNAARGHRHDYRSWCYPLPISATTPSSDILPMRSLRI